VIARREGHHAALPLLRRELQQAIGRAPQLESAAGLQAFAFEPNSGVADRAFDQRRLLDLTGDSRGRFNDVLAGNVGIIC
jgi:hypothetical protein